MALRWRREQKRGGGVSGRMRASSTLTEPELACGVLGFPSRCKFYLTSYHCMHIVIIITILVMHVWMCEVHDIIHGFASSFFSSSVYLMLLNTFLACGILVLLAAWGSSCVQVQENKSGKKTFSVFMLTQDSVKFAHWRFVFAERFRTADRRQDQEPRRRRGSRSFFAAG